MRWQFRSTVNSSLITNRHRHHFGYGVWMAVQQFDWLSHWFIECQSVSELLSCRLTDIHCLKAHPLVLPSQACVRSFVPQSCIFGFAYTFSINSISNLCSFYFACVVNDSKQIGSSSSFTTPTKRTTKHNKQLIIILCLALAINLSSHKYTTYTNKNLHNCCWHEQKKNYSWIFRPHKSQS